MRSVFASLVWKEFQELKSAVVAATAILLSIPLCYIFRDYGAALLGAYSGFWAYPVFAGVFFGMRAVAGERSRQSASFVAALPVSHRLLGTVRLLTAIVAAVIPLCANLALAAALCRFADSLTIEGLLPLGLAFGRSALGSAFCLTLAAVAGLGQTSEVRAGAVGLLSILIGALAVWMGTLVSLTGMQWVDDPDQRRFFLRLILLTTLLTLICGGIFVCAYSRALGFSSTPLRQWKIPVWQPRPIPAPLAALIWKSGRETGILGGLVFAVAVLLSVFAGALGLTNENEPATGTGLITKGLPGMLWAGGFALAILVGVGAVIGDVQSGVNTFWRSRPIPAQSWYWTKYGIGLATILLAIEVPFWISQGSAAIFNDRDSALWWPLTWNVVFSFSLTATCLVRQPLQAAVLAIGAAGILYAILQALFGSFLPGEPSAPLAILAPVFVVALIGSTVLGAWAAEHDVAIS